jgi:hypothetical protein
VKDAADHRVMTLESLDQNGRSSSALKSLRI